MNDLSKKKEFADAASDLLDNKAFKQAILDLRKRWFDELMAADGNGDAIKLIRERIKALEAIPQELTILINDFKMASDRQRKHG
jgi:hypothetical protein